MKRRSFLASIAAACGAWCCWPRKGLAVGAAESAVREIAPGETVAYEPGWQIHSRVVHEQFRDVVYLETEWVVTFKFRPGVIPPNAIVGLLKTIGTVNAKSFLGFPPRTLRLARVDLRPKTDSLTLWMRPTRCPNVGVDWGGELSRWGVADEWVAQVGVSC